MPQGWQRASTILGVIACPNCFLDCSFVTIIDVLLVLGSYVYGTVNEKSRAGIQPITQRRQRKVTSNRSPY